MNDEELNYDQIKKMMTDIEASKNTIIESQNLYFYEKWGNVDGTIPLVFVNWQSVLYSLNATHPGILGDWNTKIEETPELVEGLGVIGKYVDTFIDYVNTTRRSANMMNLSTLSAGGFIQMILDENNDESYIKTDKFIPAYLEKYVDEILEGYKKLK